MTMVRYNTETHRVVTACECGRPFTLPGYGLSAHKCACGRVFSCDGDTLEAYEPKSWRRAQESQN